jgi:hypothetical protein
VAIQVQSEHPCTPQRHRSSLRGHLLVWTACPVWGGLDTWGMQGLGRDGLHWRALVGSDEHKQCQRGGKIQERTESPDLTIERNTGLGEGGSGFTIIR